MEDAMSYTLDEFCRDCRSALASDPGPGGREAVRQLVERLLADPNFVAEHVTPAPPGRHTLYEDPELGFVVLAHVNASGGKSPPHDHGASWAVYGQVTEYTDMTEWRRTDGGTGPGPASIEVARRYRLEPGHAGTYDIRAIHAIDYPDGARFVRVTGTDLERVRRLKFDMAAGEAQIIESATAGAA
jgi:predicted metal-dependent enzyme (double-stranded beta helix superfamily)